MRTLRRGQRYILRVPSSTLFELERSATQNRVSGPVEVWYRVKDREYVEWNYDIWFTSLEELVAWRLTNYC